MLKLLFQNRTLQTINERSIELSELFFESNKTDFFKFCISPRFFRRNCWKIFNWAFAEHSLKRMLVASDYESKDRVSTFLKVLIDRTFANEHHAEILRLFSSYFNLLRFVRRKNT